MAKLNQIVRFLDEYLKIDDYKDQCYNGLQVEGKQEVKKIVFTVDSGLEVLQNINADLIIVHHGIFWKFADPSIKGPNKKKLEVLKDCSLYAAHLPLDAHKVVGNNAQLLKILNAKAVKDFVEVEGKPIGFIGKLKKPSSVNKIAEILNKEINTKCIVIDVNKPVKTIAVCSGGGSYSDFDEAKRKGADLFITGDRTEQYHMAKDNNVNVIFAGHHATETVGVKALVKIIKKKFKVECEFIDFPTNL